MNKPDMKKLVLLNLPYIFAFYFADKIAAVFRLAPGTEFIDKLTNGFAVFGTAFANPLPSFHPVDLLIGLIAGALLKLAVYVKGKNRKKLRQGEEYGSARWGKPEDIKPYMDPEFSNNVILTQTEFLTTVSYTHLLSTLDDISVEMAARRDRFLSCGCSNIIEYNAQGHEMRRIILFVDETSTLLDVRNKERKALAAQALEKIIDLARLGRLDVYKRQSLRRHAERRKGIGILSPAAFLLIFPFFDRILHGLPGQTAL